MATSAPKGLEVVGTEAAPIVIANGATKTYTHNQGVKPLSVTVVDAVNKGVLGSLAAGVAVVCAANTVALTNNGVAPVSVQALLKWSEMSAEVRAPSAQSVFV